MLFIQLALLVSLLAVGTSAATSPDAFVTWHNEARAKYGVKPVTWNNDLASYAQQHASPCAGLARTGGPYGENVVAGLSGWTTSAGLMQQWLDQSSAYTSSHAENAPYFTQVVWKSTTQIGCASVDCPAGTQMAGQTYVMCEYKPAGNVAGQYKANVGQAV
ncbi:hypothetical protein IAU60_005220 [Kwoniella sp. DSM 27419]